MLEAFREGLGPTPPPAAKRRPPRRPKAPRPARAPVDSAALLERLSSPAGLVLGALLVFVLGFALGRGTAGALAGGGPPRGGAGLVLETHLAQEPSPSGALPGGGDAAARPPTGGGASPASAAEPASTGSAAAASEAKRAAAEENTGDGFTADDRAFLDPKNRYTLRVLTCDSTPLGRDLAVASYRHLRAMGLPAIVPFLVGDSYYLCVGAVPSTKDPRLADWKARLRELDGPPPQNEPRPYASAFAVNIDDVVER